MITALVTRPREDSEGVAAELAERGLKVMVEPLLTIEAVDAEMDTGGVQGVLATSANGIRALAKAWDRRDVPVWAVGDASARVARQLGYTIVESAGGDVDGLAALVAERCDPRAGALLHAAGSVTAGDLAGRLGQSGFAVRRVVLYRAQSAGVLSESLREALADGRVDVALFFSPRTAATFATLVTAAGLGQATARITAYSLSAAVAEKLAALPWAAVRVAAAPTQAALLAAVDDDRADAQAAADPRTCMSQTEQPASAPASDTPETAPDVAGEPVAEPSAKVKSGNWVAVAIALVTVAVIGIGAAIWSEWRHVTVTESAPPPRVETVATTQELESLRTELAESRERLRRMEERLAQPEQSPAGADLTPLNNRLTQAETALHALQAQPQVPAKLTEDVAGLGQQLAELKRNSADAAAVLRLADRVEQVEAGLRAMQARRSSAAALLLAVGQLRESLAAALPFDAELRAVKALAGQDGEMAPLLDALKPRAVTGLPTRPMLTARLAAQGPAIIRAQILPEEQSWWRQTVDRLATLVTIEREDGNAAGTTPAAIVARAQAALAQGDLAAAVAEAETLTAGPAEQAAPWLADAKARLAADAAVSDMTAHVVAAIGAGQ